LPRREYQDKLDADLKAVTARRRSVRDIADKFPGKPKGAALKRRRSCRLRLGRFLKTYFPDAFNLPWSKDHRKVIKKTEAAILKGGLFADAMPRGGGKTTIIIRASLWALVYGHRRFVSIISGTEEDAKDVLEAAKTELQYNERLYEDFPEVCYPIRCLENNARRCIGQLFEGKETRIAWRTTRLTLPTMPDHVCAGRNVSGSTVTVAGITGAIRGQTHTLVSGEVIRPELVLLDDPQTRESASSPTQSAYRAEIVAGDVLGMGGPNQQIAALLPCTVIREGDLADTILNQELHPEWQGERTKLVYKFPTNEKMWGQYTELRQASLRKGGQGEEATKFYRKHRRAMDAGAQVAWPQRHYPDELSAIQHAMNLRLRHGEAAFFAEYQNEPMPTTVEDVTLMKAVDIAGKTNQLKRGLLPANTEVLTAFIDTHDNLLYWGVVAWTLDFTGAVVDYGAFPGQSQVYFTLRKASRTLGRVYPGAGREAAIRAGLLELTDKIMSREWQTETGTLMKVDLCMIDAGYEPDIVYEVCRRSPHAGRLMPSLGAPITASQKPMVEYDRKPGERLGWYWLMTMAKRRRQRYIRFDANHWKTFVHDRLAVAVGDKGCLSLFEASAEKHRWLGEHLRAEYPVRTSGYGRDLIEWKERPSKPDNHELDVLAGACVAASIRGASLFQVDDEPVRRRKRYTQADLRRVS